MPNSLSWPLLLAWIAVGLSAGIALGGAFSRWVLLLVPVGVVAAWLIWNVGFGREAGGVLLGVVSFPLHLAIQSRNPACPASGSSLEGCEHGLLWPWLSLATLLVAVGLVVLSWPQIASRSASDARRRDST